MPKHKKKPGADAPPAPKKAAPQTAPKTEIAERIETQVAAVVADKGGDKDKGGDTRWFFQRWLPYALGGKDAPVTAAPPSKADEADELEDAVDAAKDETADGGGGEDAGGEDDAEETPKALSKNAKKAMKRRAKKTAEAEAEAEALAAREKQQAPLRVALFAQLKTTAGEQLEALQKSEDWKQRTARIQAKLPGDATAQAELSKTMSVGVWKGLRAEVVAAKELADIKAVIPKIDALEAAVKQLERGERVAAVAAQFEGAAPRPLTKTVNDPADGDDHAKPKLDGDRAKHILDGDATGGQHLGAFAGNGKAAVDRATSDHHTGDFKSYFPSAWTREDVLDAIKEAAAQTFSGRVAQPKAEAWHKQRYKHPSWKITLRRIEIGVVVITEDDGAGYKVITGHPG